MSIKDERLVPAEEHPDWPEGFEISIVPEGQGKRDVKRKAATPSPDQSPNTPRKYKKSKSTP